MQSQSELPVCLRQAIPLVIIIWGCEMAELKDIVVIIRGKRKDGKGDYEGVVVEKSLMFSNLAVQIAKDSGCKEIEITK